VVERLLKALGSVPSSGRKKKKKKKKKEKEGGRSPVEIFRKMAPERTSWFHQGLYVKSVIGSPCHPLTYSSDQTKSQTFVSHFIIQKKGKQNLHGRP